MKSLRTLDGSIQNLRKYFTDDRTYCVVASLLMLILWTVSVVLLGTQRDTAGKNITPPYIRAASVTADLAITYLFATIILRSYAWIERKNYDWRSVLRSLVSYIGPAILTGLSIFLLFYGLPTVLYVALAWLPSGVSHVTVFAIVTTLYSGIVYFFVVFSVAIMIVERTVGFRNAIRSIKTSILNPIFAAAIVLPGYVLSISLIIVNAGSVPGKILSILHSAVGTLMSLFAFFVYTFGAKPKVVDNAEEP